ncbi:TetR family transcriptional regulator [Lactiplantibacillus pingfangensis]|uniref:TetR family transcriptional regulator n=1 Tax=Lactiplantibacillus pingfangensis TaxID=2559915 RepID=UPI0010F46446|nr:TetR family transcriptional regulator [Lactiplantibacillus pingfangensis]
MAFQRARSKEQVEARKHAIILSAAKVYQELGYEGLSFASIASHTDFTRPTIYNYFETKEEILILILINDLAEWCKDFNNQFILNHIYSIKDVGTIWTKCLMQHERMIELHSILFTIIAKNVSSEYLTKFEQASKNARQQMAATLAELFPNASEPALISFTFSALSLALGEFPVAKVSDLNQKNFSFEEIGIDFKNSYQDAIYLLLYGLEHNISTD